MAQSVGIKDVARAAGVSVGTVSNVINRPDTVATETRGLPVTVVVAVGTALGVVVARDVSGASTATIVSCGEFPPRCVSRGTATAAPATKVATNAVVIHARRSGSEDTRGVSGRRANVPANRVEPGPSDRRERVKREGGTWAPWLLGRSAGCRRQRAASPRITRVRGRSQTSPADHRLVTR